MTLAPTNEHSGGTRRKTLWLKTPHAAYIHRGNPVGKKPSYEISVPYLCAGSFRLLQTSVRLCESGDK